MSFSKIIQLRREGQLKKAYEVAIKEYNDNPNNIWNKRAIAWVYYDLLKNACQRNLHQKITEMLSLINGLNLPSDEKSFFESIAWCVGKFVYRYNNPFTKILTELVDELKRMPFYKPSDSYSFLIKVFSKHVEKWSGFYDFFMWWNNENFSEKDYEKTELNNGRKVISNAEQVYIAVCKNVLKHPVNNKQLEKLIPIIEQVTKEHPDMQYPHYYFAKLLLEKGNKERFLTAFIPFARKKKRDFWVWDLISQIFDKEDPRYFACLCRSLACGAPVKFSLNVKEKFAEALIRKNMLTKAKHEIDEVVNCRNQENWRLTLRLQKWMNDEKLKAVKPAGTNEKLYRKYAPEADKLLYYDIKPEIIIVEKVNREKKIVYFVTSGPKQGSFQYHYFNLNPKPGDVLSVRFSEKGNEKSPNFYKAATMEMSNEKPDACIFRTVKGTLNIKSGNSFGFVHQIFVPSETISENKLHDGQPLTLSAIRAFNKKKKEWGWKAVEIINKQ